MIVRRSAVFAAIAFMVPPKWDSPSHTDPLMICGPRRARLAAAQH
jgi:hypothetical protein